MSKADSLAGLRGAHMVPGHKPVHGEWCNKVRPGSNKTRNTQSPSTPGVAQDQPGLDDLTPKI